jgi:hypothetical protein
MKSPPRNNHWKKTEELCTTDHRARHNNSGSAGDNAKKTAATAST